MKSICMCEKREIQEQAYSVFYSVQLLKTML